MTHSRRSLSLFLSTLVVFSASVFLFPAKAHAQDPILDNPSTIQKKSEVVEQKNANLGTAIQEIQNLENRKAELANQLDSLKQEVDTLHQKIEEKKAAAEAEKKRVAELKNMFVHVNLYAAGSAGNLYTPGNCTWYVKNRRPDLPNNLGNADTWYYRAQAQGWNVGLTPKKGAAAQTKYGMHVVYIEGVSLDGQTVTLSEMNYRGLYSMNTRTAPASDFLYIYELD